MIDLKIRFLELLLFAVVSGSTISIATAVVYFLKTERTSKAKAYLSHQLRRLDEFGKDRIKRKVA